LKSHHQTSAGLPKTALPAAQRPAQVGAIAIGFTLLRAASQNPIFESQSKTRRASRGVKPACRGISGDSILQLSVWLLRSNHDTSKYLGPNLKGTAYLKFNESIDVVVNLV